MADAPGHAARDHGLVWARGLARASCPAEVGLHGAAARRRRLAAAASSELQPCALAASAVARLQRELWRLGYVFGRQFAGGIVSSGKRSLKRCASLRHRAAQAYPHHLRRKSYLPKARPSKTLAKPDASRISSLNGGLVQGYQSGRRPQLPLDDAGRPAAARREHAEVDDAVLVRITQSLLQRRRVLTGNDEDEADARVERPD